MATIKEKNILSEIILPAIGENASQLPADELVGFLSMKGRCYQGGLMVIGRALNGSGWVDGISPPNLKAPATAQAYANSVFEGVTGGDCPMSWVAERWGEAIGYNTRKSAFWRTIRAVVNGLNVANVDSLNWSSFLVWSNLYKVAPEAGGNPNSILRNIQFSGCADLLQLELNAYKPTRLLFLTGLNWANPFLARLEASVLESPDFQHVEGFGQITLDNGQQIKFAIASHPQGKAEGPWVNEVLDALA